MCQALTRIPQEEYFQTFNKFKNVYKFNLLDYSLTQKDNLTLIERKSRMPQIQGIKGEAVILYCEPLITLEMGCHPAEAGRVNKMGF